MAISGALLPRLVECGVLLAIGRQLRASGLMRSSDANTAVRLVSYLTLPSVILRVLCAPGGIAPEAWLGAGVALGCFVTSVTACWLCFMDKPKRERAVLMAASCGLSLVLLGLPIGSALLPPIACQTLVLVLLINYLAVHGVCYLFAGSAGPAFPSEFKHQDGGVYSGQWRGMRKEGLGVYCYPTGARYEGEWRENVKEGRGVYYFPQGGTYEGEWAGGLMEGVGVRTLSTGEVRAGRWRAGALEQRLDLWQCSYAAEGAAEAALAARSVEVGGGTVQDAATGLLQQAPLWAGLAGVGLAAAGAPLPGVLDAVTAVLAPANAPLSLLAAGMTLRADLPQPLMVPDTAALLATRMLVPIMVCAAQLALLAPSDHGAACALSAVLAAFAAPVPLEALAFTRRFRLNEALAAAVVGTSMRVALPQAAALCTAAAIGGILPHWVAPAVSHSPVTALLVYCLVAPVVAGAAWAYATKRFGDGTEASRVRMVYSGPADGAEGTGPERPPSSRSGGGTVQAIRARHGAASGKLAVGLRCGVLLRHAALPVAVRRWRPAQCGPLLKLRA